MISLLLILAIGIVFIIVSTSRFNLHPFLALLITAYFVAFSAGIPSGEISSIIGQGFGKTLSGIGLVIIAGTLIGVILEKSGATITISNSILKLVSEKRPSTAMSIIGYIVSIPVFCDAAFVILSALNKSLSEKTQKSIIPISIALSTGLYAPHVLIPPTPGPIAAAANLQMENLFLVIMTGIIIAIPVVAVGNIYAGFLSKKYTFVPNQDIDQNIATKSISEKSLPGIIPSLAPILLPILLMALGTIAAFYKTGDADPNAIISILEFLGSPTNALIVGLGCAFVLLPRYDKTTLTDWMEKGLTNAAKILVITGIGGALGAVIQYLPLKEYLSEGFINNNLGILIPFIIAAILKTAQGSSTVAIITASAIVYPILSGLGLDSEMGKTWVIMAIGAGAMTVSHANDSYFWVVSQFSGMNIKTAYRTHTIATLLQGTTGLIFTYIGYLLLGS
ncbi:GntP family permease [Membranihabitans maritimus]|uniref:GntP family permease n=1 Tax=Membranihabitans maritimus TaxID=2904244 RepID=UPI001F46A0D4|nr:GntP family permease [Membranihabitans maritimus]